MIDRRHLLFAALPLLVACGAATENSGAIPASGAPGTRTCAILSINDSYRIEPSPDRTGGLARVRTLRKRLSEKYPDLLLLHAGDFLFPSFLSRQYQGAQMVDVLNHLDGSDAFDPRLIVTFGNHELDDDRASVLTARIGESAFRWVSSNIDFTPAVATQKIAEDLVIECGGLQIGLFGVTIDEKSAPYIARFRDPVETARARTKALRERGAEVIVGLTHLSIDQDEAILRSLGDAGPDLIVGGHEHAKQSRTVGPRGVYKADADSRTANLLRVALGPSGVTTQAEWLALDPETAPEDPDLKSRVDGWLARQEEAYCATKMKAATGCLDERLTVANVEIEAEELSIRRFETNLGDYVLDLALTPFASGGAQIAFLNTGSLRLNYDIAPGTPITRRTVEELFAYPAPLRLIEISGETLQKVVDRAISGWTGQGHFLQIAGFAFRHDPKTGKAFDLTLFTPVPHRVAPTERIRAVVNTFLLDASKGQDGYTMLSPADIVDDLGPSMSAGPDLKQLVADAFKKAGDAGLSPKKEGRICNPERPGACRAL